MAHVITTRSRGKGEAHGTCTTRSRGEGSADGNYIFEQLLTRRAYVIMYDPPSMPATAGFGRVNSVLMCPMSGPSIWRPQSRVL